MKPFGNKKKKTEQEEVTGMKIYRDDGSSVTEVNLNDILAGMPKADLEELQYITNKEKLDDKDMDRIVSICTNGLRDGAESQNLKNMMNNRLKPAITFEQGYFYTTDHNAIMLNGKKNIDDAVSGTIQTSVLNIPEFEDVDPKYHYMMSTKNEAVYNTALNYLTSGFERKFLNIVQVIKYNVRAALIDHNIPFEINNMRMRESYYPYRNTHLFFDGYIGQYLMLSDEEREFAFRNYLHEYLVTEMFKELLDHMGIFESQIQEAITYSGMASEDVIQEIYNIYALELSTGVLNLLYEVGILYQNLGSANPYLLQLQYRCPPNQNDDGNY